MRHRHIRLVSGVFAPFVTTLWMAATHAAPLDVHGGISDSTPAPLVTISSDAGQPTYFQRAELGPAKKGGAEFGTSLAVWKDNSTGIRWAVIGAPGDDSSEGAAYLFELAPGAEQWHQTLRIAPNDGQPGDRFGTAVAIQGNTIAVGSPGHTASGHPKAGQVYLFNIDYATNALTSSGQIYGAASDNAGTGTSVALAGNIVFAGAPNALTNGAVWVGLQSGGVWTFSQAVIPTGTLDGHSFGASLAMDGTKLVVGMPNDGTGGSFSGLAFTFVYRGSGWLQEARLSAPDASVYNHFGSSVAIYGDTVAVGARDHDATKGAVYSFRFNHGTSAWDYASTLTQNGATQFGFSVSLTDRLLAVGAPGIPSATGATYLFDGGASAWRAITHPFDGIYGNAGAAVVVNDDLLMAGAPNNYSQEAFRGGAISYVYDGTTVIAQRPLAAMGTDSEAYGAAVAISADTAVVIAPGNGTSASQNTASILMRDPAGEWTWQSTLPLAEEIFVDDINYCPSAAIDNDTMLIGDPKQVVGGSNQGGVYVMRRQNGKWQRETDLVFLGGKPGDGFGCAVSISGDTAVVGAPGVHGEGGSLSAGAAYVFARNGTTWTFRQTLSVPDADRNHLYGQAVGIFNDTIVVGAPYNGRGAVYVYTRVSGAWALKKELTAPMSSDHFGTPLAIDGNTIAVGAPFTDSHNGEVLVYTGSGPSWALQAQLPAPDTSQLFGAALSLRGDALVVGQWPGHRALVYSRTGPSWNTHTTFSSDSNGVFGIAVGLSNGNVIVGDRGEQGGRAYIFQDDRIFANGYQ